MIIKVSHNNVNVVIRISMLKVTSTVVFVGLRTFTMGAGVHGLFKSICRSGANPEKVLRIRRRSHASLPSQPVNRAVQYLRRFSRDPPTNQSFSKHKQSVNQLN